MKNSELKDVVRPDMTRLLVVRHPFNRLISAFRDKLDQYKTANLEDDFYYKSYGWRAVDKHRKKALERFGPDFFSEDNNFGMPVPVDRQYKHSPKQPCFWEFVQEVLAGVRDEHWDPIASFCSVCDLEYNIIVHFEKLEFESQFVENLIDSNHVSKQGLMHFNPTLPLGMTQDELTKLYFQQLSAQDVEGLYKLYELDFRLFGYTFEYEEKIYPM